MAIDISDWKNPNSLFVETIVDSFTLLPFLTLTINPGFLYFVDLFFIFFCAANACCASDFSFGGVSNIVYDMRVSII